MCNKYVKIMVALAKIPNWLLTRKNPGVNIMNIPAQLFTNNL